MNTETVNKRARDEAIASNYKKAIENAQAAGASEDVVLTLKFLYNGIIDDEILTHPDVYEEIEETSKKLAGLTDFSSVSICQLMYAGDSEQMERDIKYAQEIKDQLEYLM